MITTTPEHPFYLAGNVDGSTRPAPVGHEDLSARWVGAGHLKDGDRLRMADGTQGTVVNVRTEQETREMFNLTVAEAHTFYVGVNGWLVHNVNYFKVDYFCDDPLVSTVRDFRHTQNNGAGNYNPEGNRAVGKYQDPVSGEEKILPVFSAQRGLGHSEKILDSWFMENGITPDKVLEIYTERYPCTTRGCNALINIKYNHVTVKYSVEFESGANLAHQMITAEHSKIQMGRFMEQLKTMKPKKIVRSK